MIVLGLTLTVFGTTGLIWLHRHPQALRRRWQPTLTVTRNSHTGVTTIRQQPVPYDHEVHG